MIREERRGEGRREGNRIYEQRGHERGEKIGRGERRRVGRGVKGRGLEEGVKIA